MLILVIFLDLTTFRELATATFLQEKWSCEICLYEEQSELEFERTEDWAINLTKNLIWLRSEIIPRAWFENKLSQDMTDFRIYDRRRQIATFKKSSPMLILLNLSWTQRYWAKSDRIN
jgi:hypothetical protein